MKSIYVVFGAVVCVLGIAIIFLGFAVTDVKRGSLGHQGIVIDCRNGQQWTIPNSMNDERDFMKELAKCPDAIRLNCDSKQDCEFAPVFIPWRTQNGVIQPMTREEIEKARL